MFVAGYSLGMATATLTVTVAMFHAGQPDAALWPIVATIVCVIVGVLNYRKAKGETNDQTR